MCEVFVENVQGGVLSMYLKQSFTLTVRILTDNCFYFSGSYSTKCVFSFILQFLYVCKIPYLCELFFKD